MSAAATGFVEIAVIIAGILLWLAGVFAVLFRGFIRPAVKLDEIKFETAERRGLFFDRVEPELAPRTEAQLRQRVVDGEVGAFASSQGESRRFVVWQAWRQDADFRAEALRRYKEYYPRRFAYLALLCGGAWSLTFVLYEPLQEALVPEAVGMLFPVYVLVAPLWIAVAVMTLFEAAKTARRRSTSKRL